MFVGFEVLARELEVHRLRLVLDFDVSGSFQQELASFLGSLVRGTSGHQILARSNGRELNLLVSFRALAAGFGHDMVQIECFGVRGDLHVEIVGALKPPIKLAA